MAKIIFVAIILGAVCMAAGQSTGQQCNSKTETNNYQFSGGNICSCQINGKYGNIFLGKWQCVPLPAFTGQSDSARQGQQCNSKTETNNYMVDGENVCTCEMHGKYSYFYLGNWQCSPMPSFTSA